MTKTVGHWNPIEPDVFGRELSGVQFQVWLVLLINCPNKTGVFNIYNLDVPKLVTKLMGKRVSRAKCDEALDNLEHKDWIRRYPNNIVWIKDRWHYVSNKNNPNTIKNAESYVAPYPTVWGQFKEYYHIHLQDSGKHYVKNSVDNSVNDSVGNKGKGEVEEKGEVKKERAVDKSTKPKHGQNQKIVTDLYQRWYQETHKGAVPKWVKADFKHLQGLFNNDFKDKELAECIEYMFKNKDDLWSGHIGTFRSLTSTKFIQRAMSQMNSGSKSNTQYLCPKACDGAYGFQDIGKPCPQCGTGITEFTN